MPLQKIFLETTVGRRFLIFLKNNEITRKNRLAEGTKTVSVTVKPFIRFVKIPRLKDFEPYFQYLRPQTMVGQQRPNITADALAKLRQAEQKVLGALKCAASAFHALSSVDATSARTSYNQHVEGFIKQLQEVQSIVRERIQQIGADLPTENATMRRLIESDLAIQRTAHLHRALVYTLNQVDEQPNPEATAPSPPYMPSPAASTPLAVFAGVASSPPAGPAPITLAVPSDPPVTQPNIAAQVAMNGAPVIDLGHEDHVMQDSGAPDMTDQMDM